MSIEANKLPKLGRGVDALFSRSFLGAGKTILELPIEAIKANEYQPRMHFDEEAIRSLAHSIKQNGLAQPILVRRLLDDSYELIAGERRLRACKLLGFQKVPCIIRQISDKESLHLALVENLDREDLNSIEVAEGYLRLIKEFSYTHQQIADEFGRSRSSITNSLRLLQLSAEIKRLLFEDKISEGHARTLLALPNTVEQDAVLAKILERGLSVRETEQLVSNSLTQDTGRLKKDKNRHIETSEKRLYLEAELTARGYSAITSGNDKKGKIVLTYKNEAEFLAIAAQFGLS